MSIKYKSLSVTISGAKPINHIEDLINEIITEKNILGAAFYETANSNDIPYSLRVADKSNTLQDFTTKYDYLSLLNGSNFRSMNGFEQAYKPFQVPGNGNRFIVGIRLDSALLIGQSISLQIIIKVQD